MKKQSSAIEVSEPVLEEAGKVVLRARSLGGEEKWAEACATLRPLAEALPGAHELWLQIAQWQALGGDATGAIETLRHAIEINRGRASVEQALRQGLTAHLFEAQSWPEAALEAEQALDLSRSANITQPARGDWARGGELGASRLRDHEMLEMLATSRAHEGRYEEAGAAMRSLVALSPRDPLHRMRLASLLQSHGALGEAAREFERVLEMVPDTFFARDAESALDLLDKAQIQQILTRAGEEADFGLRLERDVDGTLQAHSFHLSEGGRESLRQMIDDGRPDLARAPRMH